MASLSAKLSVSALIAFVLPSLAADTSLIIGPGWALARERMAISFRTPAQDVPLNFLPPETDPLSLVVLPVSSPVRLVAWQKSSASGIVATLETDLPRLRNFDLVYVVPGPSWRASYQVVVRGSPEDETARLSLDVDGRITVRNPGRAAWSNAELRLVGSALRPQATESAPGFLELDESSPLADLWRRADASEQTPFAYSFARPVTLRPGEDRSFAFVSVERRQAERVYRMSSDDLPLGGGGAGHPLRHYLALHNDAEHGLGLDLPPGSAQIFIGSVRSTLGENAWLERTPAGGELCISLGASGHLRGFRRSLGRVPGAPGQIEETFEIEIRSDLESAARVEIEELPPSRQDWAIVQSSLPYELHNRRIFYRATVPASDSLNIRYVVRTPVTAQ